MDISDGILLDLKKIIFKKKFNFIIDYNLLPRSINFKKLIYKYKVLEKNHLFNGDDYQILFTAKPKYRNAIIKYALKWNQKISRIGQITTKGSNYLRLHKKLIKIVDYQGYIHNFK